MVPMRHGGGTPAGRELSEAFMTHWVSWAELPLRACMDQARNNMADLRVCLCVCVAVCLFAETMTDAQQPTGASTQPLAPRAEETHRFLLMIPKHSSVNWRLCGRRRGASCKGMTPPQITVGQSLPTKRSFGPNRLMTASPNFGLWASREDNDSWRATQSSVRIHLVTHLTVEGGAAESISLPT